MKFWLIFAFSSISTGCLAAPCKEIQDQLLRLACYEKVETCNEIGDPSKRLGCFEDAYGDKLPIASGEYGRDQEFGLVDSASEVIEPETGTNSESETGAEVIDSVVKSAVVPATTSTQISEAEHEQKTGVSRDDELFPVKTIDRSATSTSDEKQNEKKSHEILATVVRVEFNHQRVAYLTLDNDQVWKEIARSGFKYKVGTRVTISKGIMGSTNLSAEGMSKYVKAKRIR